MAYIQADLDAINSAIASGEMEVSYRDKRIKYRSIDELISAKNLIQADLNAQSNVRPNRQLRVNVGKGI